MAQNNSAQHWLSAGQILVSFFFNLLQKLELITLSKLQHLFLWESWQEPGFFPGPPLRLSGQCFRGENGKACPYLHFAPLFPRLLLDSGTKAVLFSCSPHLLHVKLPLQRLPGGTSSQEQGQDAALHSHLPRCWPPSFCQRQALANARLLVTIALLRTC